MPRAPSKKSARKQKQAPYYPPLVMSIHGFRTDGRWQKLFTSAITASPTKAESFDYGYYGWTKFLMPTLPFTSNFNERMVDKFYDWYATTVKSCPAVDLDSYDKRPSIVAHSLGSWIVGNAMLKYDDMRFDKLILAGSILPRDFDWVTLFARDQVAFVRNECGQKDPWPRWAGRLVARTGTGGSEGFEWFGTEVENVRSEFFHSDALMRPHIERHWLPVLFQAPSPLVLLHGRNIHDGGQFSKILDHTGTVIDVEAFGNLAHYSEVEIPRGLSLNWIKVNPDIYTFLIDRQTREPAGYINAMPVDDALYSSIRSGEMVDNVVSASGIVPYLGTDTVKVYVMSIAIAEKYRRWGDGIMQQAYVQMLTGFLDKLTYYAKNNGIRATRFIATAWTLEGRRMCQFFGMTEVGKDKFGDAVFELDLEALQSAPPPKLALRLKQLLKLYKQLTPASRTGSEGTGD